MVLWLATRTGTKILSCVFFNHFVIYFNIEIQDLNPHIFISSQVVYICKSMSLRIIIYIRSKIMMLSIFFAPYCFLSQLLNTSEHPLVYTQANIIDTTGKSNIKKLQFSEGMHCRSLVINSVGDHAGCPFAFLVHGVYILKLPLAVTF